MIVGDRGGLILYRTVVGGAALDGNSVLDIGEPVRDYAKVCMPPGTASAAYADLPLPTIGLP